MSKILLTGRDLRLLNTRAEVLKRTGADVIWCSGPDALKLIKLEMLDLVVLCHSLPEVEAEKIIEAVRRQSHRAKILMVIADPGRERFFAKDAFDATTLAEPARLISRANELLQMSSAASYL